MSTGASGAGGAGPHACLDIAARNLTRRGYQLVALYQPLIDLLHSICLSGTLPRSDAQAPAARRLTLAALPVRTMPLSNAGIKLRKRPPGAGHSSLPSKMGIDIASYTSEPVTLAIIGCGSRGQVRTNVWLPPRIPQFLNYTRRHTARMRSPNPRNARSSPSQSHARRRESSSLRHTQWTRLSSLRPGKTC